MEKKARLCNCHPAIKVSCHQDKKAVKYRVAALSHTVSGPAVLLRSLSDPYQNSLQIKLRSNRT